MGPKSRLGNSCWSLWPALSMGEDLVSFRGPPYLVENVPVSAVLEKGEAVVPPAALRLSLAAELRDGQALPSLLLEAEVGTLVEKDLNLGLQDPGFGSLQRSFESHCLCWARLEQLAAAFLICGCKLS